TYPYVLWSALMIVIPLILIAIYAFTTDGNTVKTLNFTGENFARIMEPTYLNVFWKSIKMGVITTFICLLVGYPLAYMISRCREEVQGLLILAVTIPTWINMLL